MCERARGGVATERVAVACQKVQKRLQLAGLGGQNSSEGDARMQRCQPGFKKKRLLTYCQSDKLLSQKALAESLITFCVTGMSRARRERNMA